MQRRISLPDEKGYDQAYALAFRLAVEKLSALPDVEQQCRAAAVECRTDDARKYITIPFLGQLCVVSLPDAVVTYAASGEPVAMREKLLILHYFLRASGAPLAGKAITFRELPEGVVYFPTFAKRTIKPLVDNYGKQPQLLLDAASALFGATPAQVGDVAVTVPAFPRVPLTLVLWRGDAEFPAEGSVMFDATIPDYLATEDITVLCEIVAWKLVRAFPELERRQGPG